MKIIINATNRLEERPLREAQRLINKGLAHLPAYAEGTAINPQFGEVSIIENEKLPEAVEGDFELKTYKPKKNKKKV